MQEFRIVHCRKKYCSCSKSVHVNFRVYKVNSNGDTHFCTFKIEDHQDSFKAILYLFSFITLKLGILTCCLFLNEIVMVPTYILNSLTKF